MILFSVFKKKTFYFKTSKTNFIYLKNKKPEGEDELKKKQLMELAIINGTYRDGSKLQQKMNQILLPGGMVATTTSTTNGLANGAATPNGLAAAILASQHQQQQQQQQQQTLNGMGLGMGNLGAIGLGGLTTVSFVKKILN